MAEAAKESPMPLSARLYLSKQKVELYLAEFGDIVTTTAEKISNRDNLVDFVNSILRSYASKHPSQSNHPNHNKNISRTWILLRPDTTEIDLSKWNPLERSETRILVQSGQKTSDDIVETPTSLVYYGCSHNAVLELDREFITLEVSEYQASLSKRKLKKLVFSRVRHLAIPNSWTLKKLAQTLQVPQDSLHLGSFGTNPWKEAVITSSQYHSSVESLVIGHGRSIWIERWC